MVTGGGTGIGFAIAERLVSRGATVALAGRREDVIAAAAGRLNESAGREVAVAAPADVTSSQDVAGAFAVAEEAFGALSILVNNAGAGSLCPIRFLEADIWDSTFATSAKSVFLCTREYVNRLVPTGRGGAIVNVTSLNGMAPGATAGHAAYASAKAAVHQFTRVAALELAEHGIRVNAVAPGSTRTPMFDDDAVNGPLGQAFIARTPLGRMGEPGDVADIAVFLCTEESRWLTGEQFAADGGVHLSGVPNFWETLRPVMEAVAAGNLGNAG